MIGTITKVKTENEYAFLTDEMGINRFLHFSNFQVPLERELKLGDIVMFEPELNRRTKQPIALRAMLIENRNSTFSPSNIADVMGNLGKKDETEKSSNLFMKTYKLSTVEDVIKGNIFELDFVSMIAIMTIDEESAIITGLMRALPMDTIILEHNESGNSVLKGKNTIMALYGFINNEFALNNSGNGVMEYELDGEKSKLEGRYFNKPGHSSLNEQMQNILLQKKIPVYLVNNEGRLQEERQIQTYLSAL